MSRNQGSSGLPEGAHVEEFRFVGFRSMNASPAEHTDGYWHVRVEIKHPDPTQQDRLTVLDQDLAWVEKRILERRRDGAPITIEGRQLDWSDIKFVRISRSDQPSSNIIPGIEAEDANSPVLSFSDPEYPWRAAKRGTDMTNELIDGPVGQAAQPSPVSPATPAADARKVMVVHGRDEEARRAMFDFLRALGLSPLEWGTLVAETGTATPYIGEVLSHAFGVAKAVVVLFTPDDEAFLRRDLRGAKEPEYETDLTPQARPNVLFEAGMAFGVHPDRTVLVELGSMRPFSDIYGRHVVRLNGTDKPLRDIARRLKKIGCDVDDSNDDWASTRFPERD
jgi:predicted nucleotide-binding protein